MLPPSLTRCTHNSQINGTQKEEGAAAAAAPLKGIPLRSEAHRRDCGALLFSSLFPLKRFPSDGVNAEDPTMIANQRFVHKDAHVSQFLEKMDPVLNMSHN